jgi:hypothetical protein
MTQETDSSKRRVYLEAALFAILVLVAAFFLFLAFVGGIIGALLSGNFTLLAGAAFFFVLFVVTGALAKKLEPSWQKLEEIRGIKRKTTRESLKEGLPLIVIIALALVLGMVYEEYFLSFPSTITSSLGQELLNSVLTIDGILMGLCGVVLAQFLWAIHSKGNMIYEQMITHRNDNAIITDLNNELDRLSKARLGAIVSVFYSLMPILASFMICLSRLPMTEGTTTVSPRALLFDPILALIVGVILLTMITLQVNLLPKKSAPLVGSQT